MVLLQHQIRFRCALCIVKIKDKGYGQHTNCNICSIEKIKDEKKNKLNENIKYLQDLSNNLEKTNNELKAIFDNINKSREEIKLKVQKIFTKIRTVINEREDELLSEIDNKFNENFGKQDIIEESIKLPNKIKKYLEKGKLSDNDWNNNNKLSSLINDCINIEDNIKKINIIHDNIKKCNLNKKTKIVFTYNETIDDFINQIKTFGNIYEKSDIIDIDTLILKNKGDLNNFFNLISTKIKINKMQLLYRASKDGLNYKSIVSKINNRKNLIFLYYTGNKRIFGVFIKTKLENITHRKYFKDENAFVFNLNEKKIYKILIPDNAIRFYNDNNIIGIGNTGDSNGFYFSSEKIKDQGLLSNPKIYDFQKDYELTDNLNIYTELEIFEINYN